MIASEKTMPHNVNNDYQPSSQAVPPPRDSFQMGSVSGDSRTVPGSLNEYADGLMDDLFEEVEKVLERGAIAPLEPPRPQPRPRSQPISVPFVSQPPVGLATAIADRQAQWQGDDGTDTLMRQAQAPLATLPTQPARTLFDRFLIAATCTSAIAALAVWAVTQGWGSRLWAGSNSPSASSVPGAPAAPVETTSPFAQYMQRALAAIDRVAANSPTGIPANLPTAPTSAPTPLSSLSRLPLAPLPSVPLAANNSSQTGIQAATQNELNQILTRLSNVLERLNLSVNRTAPAPLSQIQIRPMPTTGSAPVAAVPAALQRTLTGVYQAQDPTQSVVLFEMNGVTQRYYVGESIGTSGWSLIEVAKNSAVFRRNGEVLTVEQGQSLK
jgi:hypothetical protein